MNDISSKVIIGNENDSFVNLEDKVTIKRIFDSNAPTRIKYSINAGEKSYTTPTEYDKLVKEISIAIAEDYQKNILDNNDECSKTKGIEIEVQTPSLKPGLAGVVQAQRKYLSKPKEDIDNPNSFLAKYGPPMVMGGIVGIIGILIDHATSDKLLQESQNIKYTLIGTGIGGLLGLPISSYLRNKVAKEQIGFGIDLSRSSLSAYHNINDAMFRSV